MDDKDFDRLQDADLLAYLDGELSPELTDRINRSPHLRERAAQLAQMENHLQRTFFRSNCPDTMALSEYAAGMAADRTRIERHLRFCPYCTAEVAEARRFLAESAADIRHDLLTRTRILIASLLPEPPGGMLIPGVLGAVRGSAAAPLTYEVEEFQVSLEVQDDPAMQGRRQVVGLVLGPVAGDWQAYAWLGDTLAADSEIDAIGNFTLSGLAPGEYQLSLSGEGLALEIHDLSV
jgi:anti-sigma factor RsiW